MRNRLFARGSGRIAARVPAGHVGVIVLEGRAVRVLGPGHWRCYGRALATGRARVVLLDRREPRLRHPELALLLELPALWALVRVVDVSPGEFARVWRADRLEAVLLPGRAVFWSEPGPVVVERFRPPGGSSLPEALASALAGGPVPGRAAELARLN
jgi:hypothetical protein